MFDISAESYPYNLLSYVFNGTSITLPDDIVETMDFLVGELPSHEQLFIRLRFVEGKSTGEIRDIFGYAGNASIYRIRNRIVLKLRHPYRFKCIQNGLAKQQQNLAER